MYRYENNQMIEITTKHRAKTWWLQIKNMIV